MGTFTYVQSSFSRGALDPRLSSRTDFEGHKKGAKTLTNTVVIPQGGIKTRFGTDYVYNIEGATDYTKIRIQILELEDSTKYLLIFEDIKVTILQNDTFLTSIISPYTEDQLATVKFSQTHNELISVHQDVAPYRLFIDAASSTFKYIPVDFVHQPTYDFSDNYFHATFTLSSGSIGDNVALTITATIEYPAVIDQRDMINNTPAGPGLGDRYIHDGEDGTLGAVSIKKGDILEYNGATWDRSPDGTSTNTPPANNGVAFDTARAAYYIFNSTSLLWRYYGTTLFAFSEDYVDGLFVAGDGTMRFTNFVSATVMNGTVTDAFNPKVYPGDSVAITQPVFNQNHGYPRGVGFFQNRLWLGGTDDLPSGIFSSKSGSDNYFNFDDSGGEGNDGISLFVNTGKTNIVKDILGARNLFIFTTNGVSVSITLDDSGITPSNAGLELYSISGISNVDALYFDNQVIFCDKGGKIIHSLVYDVQQQGFVDNDISILSQHLIKTPVSMAIFKNPSTDNGSYLIVANADGSLAILTSLFAEDVRAWTNADTANGTDSFREVISSEDDIYFLVERFADGQLKFYIEKLNFNRRLDCSIDFLSGIPTTTITGLSHLEGYLVNVIGDGYYLGNFTVTNGEVEVETAISTAQVGIGFNPLIEFLPISIDTQAGSLFYRPKTYKTAYVDYYESLAITFNDEAIPDLIADVSTFDTVPDPKTGFSKVTPMNGWDIFQTNSISQNAPFNMLIRAVGFEVQID